MTKGERTRRRIVSEAARLFNTKGAATSIGDVLEATGLEKGGLYRYFDSKEQLRAEAFAHAVATVSAHHRAARRDAENSVDALHAAIAAFEGLRGLSPIPGGCPLFNAAVEADDGDASLRGPVRRALAAMRAGYAEIVARGIDAGEIRRESRPETVATILMCALEGAVVLARLERDDRPLRAVCTHLDAYVESLRAC